MSRDSPRSDSVWADVPSPRDVMELVAAAAVAAAFYVAPWPLVYVPAGLVLAALVWWRLELGLYIVPLFVPYFMHPKHFGTAEFAPSEILIVLDVAVAVSYLILRRWSFSVALRRISQTPFLLPAGLFLFAATLSTALAADRHLALREYREVVVEPILYFGLLLLTLRSARQWWLFLTSVAASGVVVGLIAIGQYVTRTGLTVTPGTSIERVRALYGSPDNVGLLFDRVIPVWVVIGSLWVLGFSRLGVLGRSDRSGPADGDDGIAIGYARGIVAAVILLAGLVLFGALALTFSRGAWLAAGIGILFVLVLAYPWGRWLAIACAVVAIAGVVVGGEKIEHAFRAGHANTVQRRLDLWRSSVRMIRQRPIVGVGPDNFLHYYAPTRKQDPWQRLCKPGLGYILPSSGVEPCLSHPHDEVLDFWLSAGILGLAAFVWLEAVFWRHALQAWLRRDPGTTRWLALAAMGAMLAALVHGLVDQSYFLMDLSVLFWSLCACVAFVASGRSPRVAPAVTSLDTDD